MVEIGFKDDTFVVTHEGVIQHVNNICDAVICYMETDPSHAAIIASLAMKEIKERLEKLPTYRGNELYTT